MGSHCPKCNTEIMPEDLQEYDGISLSYTNYINCRNCGTRLKVELDYNVELSDEDGIDI